MLKRKNKTEAPLIRDDDAASISITALQDSASNFWYYFIGGIALSVIALMAGMLLVQFVEHRPVNLTSHTNYLVDELQKSLEQQYIPAASIKKGLPTQGGQENRFWNEYRLEVDLPTHVSADGLTRLIREAMLSYFVEVSEQPVTGPDRELTLSLGDISFAQLLLHAAPESVAFPKTDLRPTALRIADDLHKQLLDDGIPAALLQRGEPVEEEDLHARWVHTRFTLTIPESISPERFLENLRAFALQYDARITTSILNSGIHEYVVVYGAKPCIELRCTLGKEEAGTKPGGIIPKPNYEEVVLPEQHELLLDSEENGHDTEPGEMSAIEPRPEGKPRIALILDDGGYGGSVTEQILALNPNLTLALLPNAPAAEITAEQAAARGFELLLHMPMETSSETVKAYPGQLNTDMDADQIQKLTEKALSQIPYVQGVNNHTGSKFMAQEEKVIPFLKLLKEKKIFFVDSRTRADSMAYDAALSLELPTARRDVFLDNDNAPEEIQKQWDKLIETARKRGTAVGIGHFRENTVRMLAENLSQLEQTGVELVHVSELLQ